MESIVGGLWLLEPVSDSAGAGGLFSFFMGYSFTDGLRVRLADWFLSGREFLNVYAAHLRRA